MEHICHRRLPAKKYRGQENGLSLNGEAKGSVVTPLVPPTGLGGGSGPPDIIRSEIEESSLILIIFGFK